jgi:hypothetical protein
LDSGKLYVARFDSDFSGQWLELSNLTGTQARGTETFTFGDSSDAYLNTRFAADKKGATPMDRPEWGAVNPVNGEVYLTLTKHAGRTVALTDPANPRSYKDNSTSATTGNPNGHIIRWRETGSDPTATSFTWDIYVFGAESDDLNNPQVNLSGLTADNFLSAPDGLWFSEKTGTEIQKNILKHFATTIANDGTHGEGHGTDKYRQALGALHQSIAGNRIINTMAGIARFGDDGVEGTAIKRRVHLIGDLFKPALQHRQGHGIKTRRGYFVHLTIQDSYGAIRGQPRYRAPRRLR